MTKQESEYTIKLAKKIKAINMLGGKCEICGDNIIPHMTFHHRNPEEKEYDISDIFQYARWSVIEKEILKCQLLCHNCHEEIHTTGQSHHSRKKILCLEHKKIYECEECGYDRNYGVLHFHHIDQKEKISGIQVMLRYSSVLELNDTIQKELEKCIILCSNCHNTIHFNMEKFEKFRTLIYEKVNTYIECPPAIDRNKVIQMYKSGMKQSEITKQLGCAKSTISGILTKFSV